MLREEIEKLITKSDEANGKAKEASNHLYNYQGVLNKLNAQRDKQAFHQKNVEKIKENLKERSESDEWLQSELENFDQRTRSRQDHQQKLREQYLEIDNAINRCRERLSRKHAEIGRYEEQKASHEQQIEHRKDLIRETSRQHGIRGYETNLNDARIQEYVEKVVRLSKSQNDALEKARKETESEMRSMQEILDGLNERRSTLVAEQKNSKEQAMSNDQRMKAFRSELSKMNVDEGELAILDAKIEQLEEELEKARNDYRAASFEKSIEEQDARLRSQTDKIRKLNDEMVQGTKHANALAQSEHLQKELADRHRDLDKMKSVHQQKLQALLHHYWQPSSLEGDFQSMLHQKTQKIKDAERERSSVSRDLDQMDLEIGNTEKGLTSGKAERARCERRLRENLEKEPEEYAAELEELQQGRDLLYTDIVNFDNEKELYRTAIKVANTKHKCKLCNTHFDNAKQAELVRSWERKLEKNDDLVKQKQQLVEVEEALRKVKAVGPTHETWNRLKGTELPKLESKLEDLSSKRAGVVQKLEDHDGIVNGLEQEKADLDSLAKPVANISRYNNEVNGFSGQIEELQKKQKQAALPRTLHEIQEQIDQANQESRSASNMKDKLSSDKEGMRSKINSLELQLKDAKNDLSKANYDLKDKGSKLKQIEEIGGANQTLRDRSRQIDDKLRELTPQIENAQGQTEEARARGNQKQSRLRDDALKLSASVNRLEQAEKSVRKYTEEGGSTNLERCQREIDSLEQEIQTADKDRTVITRDANKISEELRDQEDTKRIIRDNLDYRTSLRELDALKSEIASLESQHAEADQDHWQREAQRWQNLHTRYSTERTTKTGQAVEKDNLLAKLLADWQTDYKDAAHDYKKAHIEVETTKAAVEDLGRYGGALDKAIMKYHSVKMAEINRIIEELWKKTYQGTDVDNIRISSDDGANKGNRSYNYRVCMIKQDVEMDMRGRCSAGQKVLASIIIRLALAECFGVHCGLLALDEPTTNLDRDNIQSLAQSLHDIIQTRRHQANFQLIVITHDEEFLQYMKCPDFCDDYYRVSRNERQKSIISQQSISNII